MVQRPPGRADHDLGARRSRGGLRPGERPPYSSVCAEAVGCREWREHRADLNRQLARGDQHQRLDAAHGGVDALDERQRERERLARARARLADDVAAVQKDRNGPGLNRGWLHDALRLEQTLHSRRKGKIGEFARRHRQRHEDALTPMGPTACQARR